jgi:hypothetical protein
VPLFCDLQSSVTRADGGAVRQGAPIAGWILGAYGGSAAGHAAFRPAIYYAGSLAVVAALLVLAMRQVALKNLKVLVYI